MVRVYIEENLLFKNKVIWFFELIERNHNAKIVFEKSYENADFTIGIMESADITLSKDFYEKLNKGIYCHNIHMTDGPYILKNNKEIDYISSVFYLTNCIQEYYSDDLDEYDRFKYQNSLQKKWGIISKNKVLEYIRSFCARYNIAIGKSKLDGFLLSHDIDFLNKGWKHELLYNIKLLKIHSVISIMYARAFGKGVFNNIVDIAKLEDRHKFTSMFFWLPRQGQCKKGIQNSDYDMKSRLVRHVITKTFVFGSSHGLHKSSFETTINEECTQLGFPTSINRFHYLKLKLPESFDQLQNSAIRIDCSLGFPEHIGFRNNYGLPFFPYNLKEDRPYSFLEVPLHIMDTTFTKYMKLPKDKIPQYMYEWIDAVKEDALITILWHNNYLSEHSQKEMKKIYIQLLGFLSNQKLKNVSYPLIESVYFTKSYSESH